MSNPNLDEPVIIYLDDDDIRMRNAERRAREAVFQWVRDNAPALRIMWEWGDGRGGGLLETIAREIGMPSILDAPPASRQAGGEVSSRKRWRIYKRDGYACVRCGTDNDLTVDHVHPRSKGGDNSEENLQTLCRTCNSSKGNRL